MMILKSIVKEQDKGKDYRFYSEKEYNNRVKKENSNDRIHK